jgi:hypothetical protein
MAAFLTSHKVAARQATKQRRDGHPLLARRLLQQPGRTNPHKHGEGADAGSRQEVRPLVVAVAKERVAAGRQCTLLYSRPRAAQKAIASYSTPRPPVAHPEQVKPLATSQ